MLCGARFIGGFFFGSVLPSAFPWIFPSPLGFRSRCRPFPCRHAVLSGQAGTCHVLAAHFAIAPRNAAPLRSAGTTRAGRKKSADKDRPWRGSREEDDGFKRGRARRHGGRFRVSGVHRHAASRDTTPMAAVHHRRREGRRTNDSS
jgi:hypothetical protein